MHDWSSLTSGSLASTSVSAVSTDELGTAVGGIDGTITLHPRSISLPQTQCGNDADTRSRCRTTCSNDVQYVAVVETPPS